MIIEIRWFQMLEDKGNTAVYLLYAYTRICSIARNANVSVSQLEQAAASTRVAIQQKQEWKLAKVKKPGFVLQ